MVQIHIPPYVLKLMGLLEDAGYEAWTVGGCVRDSFLSLTPNDWDLCTNALPQEMKQVFSGFPLVLNGEKHGTVSVIVDGIMVEITTFRSEGDYSDSRHPQWVHFETDICKDLARRDFTVNAMAYSPKRGLADPWGGQQDLKKRVLRAVGNPEQRFREDALRILRGARFAARFSLVPEESTLAAMNALCPSIAFLARERVFSELCGFLTAADTVDVIAFQKVLTAAIAELSPMVGFQQHNPYHIYDVYTHTAHVVGNSPATLVSRWAALLHDVGKPSTFSQDEDGIGHFYRHAQVGKVMAQDILEHLRAPKALTQQVCAIISYHGATRDLAPKVTDRTMKKLLRNLGEPTLRALMALDRADDTGKGTLSDQAPFDLFQKRLEQVLAEKPCLKISDLAIGGKTLMALGIPQGPELGQILGRLLDEVTAGSVENQESALIARAMKLHKSK